MRVIAVFIQNSKNKILVQKRSRQKNGKYGITSGHVKVNETSLEGAIREIKEELGIDIKEEELELFYKAKQSGNLYNLYYLKKDVDINSLKLQKEEVEFVKWCTKEEIEELIRSDEFFENHIEAFEIFRKLYLGG